MWFKENKLLLLIVFFLWLSASVVYYISSTKVEDFNATALKLVEYAEGIKIDKSNLADNLTKLISEIRKCEVKAFWGGLFRSISAGLFVSGILILGVDIHTRWKLRKEVEEYRDSVASSVWKAVSGRLIPKEISNEIDNILKSDVIRNDCYYTITFKEPYHGMSEDFILVQREISYTAINLTNKDNYEYTVRSSFLGAHYGIQGTLNNETINLPRHISFKIDDVWKKIEDCVDESVKFEYSVKLPKSKTEGKLIYLKSEEACRKFESNSYILGTITKDLTIIINNKLKNTIKVKDPIMHHSRARETHHPQENIWKLEGGFFPGQGFCVEWEEV